MEKKTLFDAIVDLSIERLEVDETREGFVAVIGDLLQKAYGKKTILFQTKKRLNQVQSAEEIRGVIAHWQAYIVEKISGFVNCADFVDGQFQLHPEQEEKETAIRYVNVFLETVGELVGSEEIAQSLKTDSIEFQKNIEPPDVVVLKGPDASELRLDGKKSVEKRMRIYICFFEQNPGQYYAREKIARETGLKDSFLNPTLSALSKQYGNNIVLSKSSGAPGGKKMYALNPDFSIKRVREDDYAEFVLPKEVPDALKITIGTETAGLNTSRSEYYRKFLYLLSLNPGRKFSQEEIIQICYEGDPEKTETWYRNLIARMNDLCENDILSVVRLEGVQLIPGSRVEVVDAHDEDLEPETPFFVGMRAPREVNIVSPKGRRFCFDLEGKIGNEIRQILVILSASGEAVLSANEISEATGIKKVEVATRMRRLTSVLDGKNFPSCFARPNNRTYVLNPDFECEFEPIAHSVRVFVDEQEFLYESKTKEDANALDLLLYLETQSDFVTATGIADEIPDFTRNMVYNAVRIIDDSILESNSSGIRLRPNVKLRSFVTGESVVSEDLEGEELDALDLVLSDANYRICRTDYGYEIHGGREVHQIQNPNAVVLMTVLMSQDKIWDDGELCYETGLTRKQIRTQKDELNKIPGVKIIHGDFRDGMYCSAVNERSCCIENIGMYAEDLFLLLMQTNVVLEAEDILQNLGLFAFSDVAYIMQHLNWLYGEKIVLESNGTYYVDRSKVKIHGDFRYVLSDRLFMIVHPEGGLVDSVSVRPWVRVLRVLESYSKVMETDQLVSECSLSTYNPLKHYIIQIHKSESIRCIHGTRDKGYVFYPMLIGDSYIFEGEANEKKTVPLTKYERRLLDYLIDLDGFFLDPQRIQSMLGFDSQLFLERELESGTVVDEAVMNYLKPQNLVLEFDEIHGRGYRVVPERETDDSMETNQNVSTATTPLSEEQRDWLEQFQQHSELFYRLELNRTDFFRLLPYRDSIEGVIALLESNLAQILRFDLTGGMLTDFLVRLECDAPSIEQRFSFLSDHAFLLMALGLRGEALVSFLFLEKWDQFISFLIEHQNVLLSFDVFGKSLVRFLSFSFLLPAIDSLRVPLNSAMIREFDLSGANLVRFLEYRNRDLRFQLMEANADLLHRFELKGNSLVQFFMSDSLDVRFHFLRDNAETLESFGLVGPPLGLFCQNGDPATKLEALEQKRPCIEMLDLKGSGLGKFCNLGDIRAKLDILEKEMAVFSSLDVSSYMIGATFEKADLNEVRANIERLVLANTALDMSENFYMDNNDFVFPSVLKQALVGRAVGRFKIVSEERFKRVCKTISELDFKKLFWASSGVDFKIAKANIMDFTDDPLCQQILLRYLTGNMTLGIKQWGRLENILNFGFALNPSKRIRIFSDGDEIAEDRDLSYADSFDVDKLIQCRSSLYNYFSRQGVTLSENQLSSMGSFVSGFGRDINQEFLETLEGVFRTVDKLREFLMGDMSDHEMLTLSQAA